MASMKTLAIVGLAAAAGVGVWMKFGCGACGSCPLESATSSSGKIVAVSSPTNTAALAAPLAVPAPAAPGKAAEGAAFNIDTVHTSVVYGIMHQSVSRHYGRFNSISGTFNIDPANPAGSSINITVKTDSIDSGNKGRDDHLRGPDFFSAKEFPEMTFKGETFAKTGDKALDVTGTLTFHGQTKTVTFPVEYFGIGKGRSGEVSGFEAKFTIKRSDYGMGNMIGMLGDDVQLIISAEGGR